MPRSVLSLSRRRSRTGSGTRLASGSTATRIRYRPHVGRAAFTDKFRAQAHPIACAASLAVQKVIANENLLANARQQGEYLSSLLKERLWGPNAFAAPYTFDIRGAGCWWGIEFDFSSPDAAKVDLRGQSFAIAVQQRALDHDLIIMGMSGTSSLDGTRGDAILLSPAYNVTKEQVERIVDVFVQTVEEVIREHLVS